MMLRLTTLLFLGLILNGGFHLNAQYIKSTGEPKFVITRPVPKEGDSAWFVYLNQQLEFRRNVPADGMQDTLLLSFTVDTIGRIVNPWVAPRKKKNDSLDSALVRAMRNGLPWNPGTINGTPQEVHVSISMEMNIHPGGRDTFALRPSSTTRFEEAKPIFPGGQSAFTSYLQTNIVYPELESKKGVEGVVYVFFKVQRDGKITEVRTVREVPDGPGLSREAERVVRMMPDWLPGCMNGSAVTVGMTIPIRFSR